MNLKLTAVKETNFANVNHADAPDYVDAYIQSATIEISREEYNLAQGKNQAIYNGKFYRDATEAELDFLNNDPDNASWKYEQLMNFIH